MCSIPHSWPCGDLYDSFPSSNICQSCQRNCSCKGIILQRWDGWGIQPANCVHKVLKWKGHWSSLTLHEMQLPVTKGGLAWRNNIHIRIIRGHHSSNFLLSSWSITCCKVMSASHLGKKHKFTVWSYEELLFQGLLELCPLCYQLSNLKIGKSVS